MKIFVCRSWYQDLHELSKHHWAQNATWCSKQFSLVIQRFSSSDKYSAIFVDLIVSLFSTITTNDFFRPTSRYYCECEEISVVYSNCHVASHLLVLANFSRVMIENKTTDGCSLTV